MLIVLHRSRKQFLGIEDPFIQHLSKNETLNDGRNTTLKPSNDSIRVKVKLQGLFWPLYRASYSDVGRNHLKCEEVVLLLFFCIPTLCTSKHAMFIAKKRNDAQERKNGKACRGNKREYETKIGIIDKVKLHWFFASLIITNISFQNKIPLERPLRNCLTLYLILLPIRMNISTDGSRTILSTTVNLTVDGGTFCKGKKHINTTFFLFFLFLVGYVEERPW